MVTTPLQVTCRGVIVMPIRAGTSSVAVFDVDGKVVLSPP
jgi:hypothetical protein